MKLYICTIADVLYSPTNVKSYLSLKNLSMRYVLPDTMATAYDYESRTIRFQAPLQFFTFSFSGNEFVLHTMGFFAKPNFAHRVITLSACFIG